MGIHEDIQEICGGAAFHKEVVDLLTKLCLIDTSPCGDIERMRQNEDRIFALIQQELAAISLKGARVEKRPIPARLERHPAFTTPYYAVGADGLAVPSSAEVYAGRHNLLFLLDRPHSPAGNNTAVNAHVDVVAPYVGPRTEGDVLYGRGGADDKGNVAGIIATLKVLKLLEDHGTALRNKVTVMFAIDEEIGGNGSLALSTDRSLRRRYDSLLVLECTGNVIHPANRGAVYLKVEATLAQGSGSDGAGGVSVTEAFCYGIRELGLEARRIREESEDAMFSERPVYLCPGILGPFGVHPSSICGEVECVLQGVPAECSLETLCQIVEEGIRAYVEEYGDKTREVDPRTAEPKVKRHYELSRAKDGRVHLRVYGLTGHLGALPKNDPAILKLAYIGFALCEYRARGGLPFSVAVQGIETTRRLAFEGAQGFLPSHGIEQVKLRVRQAFLRGVTEYLRIVKAAPDSIRCDVSFNKLHNESFASDPNSASVQRALRAAKEAGTMEERARLQGWNASCDARLFAIEHPNLPVITCGAGTLEAAHSAAEWIFLPELFKMVEFTSLFLVRETGSG